MARKIKKTLFSKNHITVSQTKNVEHFDPCVRFDVSSNTDNNSWKPYKKTTYTVEVVKESPLGFKYTSKETVHKKSQTQSKGETKFILKVNLRKMEYELVYPLTYGDVKINVETRPWDIVEGDKSMPDHFIFALKKVVDDLLSIIKENKLAIVSFSYPHTMTYQELHDKLYVDLFGNRKGIRFQTDDEKLLAHGFDKITSFRKM